jgi:hypothetical protein
LETRTERLIAAVESGATLEDAARMYGITRERVRQILKKEGVTAHQLPGRREKIRRRRLALQRELAPAIEAMWREGMLNQDIAKIVGISRQGVEAIIHERVPRDQRISRTALTISDGRPADERFLQGLRAAAKVLGQMPSAENYDHARAQGLIDGWLAARQERVTGARADRPEADAAMPEASEESTGTGSPPASAGVDPSTDLRIELDGFRTALRAGGLGHATVHSYLVGSTLFVRWLAGEYIPGPGRAHRAQVRTSRTVSREACTGGLCPECRA